MCRAPQKGCSAQSKGGKERGSYSTKELIMISPQIPSTHPSPATRPNKRSLFPRKQISFSALFARTQTNFSARPACCESRCGNARALTARARAKARETLCASIDARSRLGQLAAPRACVNLMPLSSGVVAALDRCVDESSRRLFRVGGARSESRPRGAAGGLPRPQTCCYHDHRPSGNPVFPSL